MNLHMQETGQCQGVFVIDPSQTDRRTVGVLQRIHSSGVKIHIYIF